MSVILNFARAFLVVIFVTTNIRIAMAKESNVPLGESLDSLQPENSSDACSSALTLLLNGGKTKDKWALKMFDASGKIPAEIKRDSLSSIGLYDQCLNIGNEYQGGRLTGQYCSIVFRSLNASEDSSLENSTEISAGTVIIKRPRFQWDVCVPGNCTEDALNLFLSEAFVDVDLEAQNCLKKKTDVELKTSQIVAISFFSVLAAFLLFGSLLHLALCIMARFRPKTSDKKERGKIISIFLAFSLYGNAKKILQTNKPAGTLDAVHGIRFLSMAWIILGHTYSLLNLSLVTNFSEVKKYEEDVAFQVVLKSSAAADTFFFLSALVIVYSTLRTLKIQGEINWPLLYLHRFIRLTPAYGFAILFSFIMPLMGSGPFWEQNWTKVTDNCERNWWPAILYVNNFVEPDRLCLQQSWFLSNLMQFFLITPLILVFLWKLPIVGLLLNTLFLAATFIAPALLMMGKNVQPSINPGMENIGEYMSDIYLKPYSRIGPYCIGIYIGYLLCCHKNVKIFSVVRAILWCLSIACNLAVIYGPYEWNRSNHSSKEVKAFYVASHGTAFALGLAWITHSCCTGYGGIVNKILSWRAFVPLSRVTYMAFFIHPFVIYAYNWSLRDQFTVSHYYVVLLYLGFLVITYGVSFLASIIFEAPFIGVEKAVLKESSKDIMKEVNESEHDDEELPVINAAEVQKTSYEPIEEPSRVNAAYVENEAKTNF